MVAARARALNVLCSRVPSLRAPVQLRAGGYTADQLYAAGFAAEALRDGGFKTADIVAGGYTTAELKAANLPVKALRLAGVPVEQLLENGYSVSQARTTQSVHRAMHCQCQCSATYWNLTDAQRLCSHVHSLMHVAGGWAASGASAIRVRNVHACMCVRLGSLLMPCA